ncbi:MAG TPA: DUF3106 domain-containing protein [Rhodocyclaceae bacterium]|nr:DUF3106 domain-containing protein [Rhodocyclaceae bacterium]
MAQKLRAALSALVCAWAGAVGAASTPIARPASAPLAASAKTAPVKPLSSSVKAAPGWNQLTPQQQTILAPLEKDWNSFTNTRKRKWVGIADRYPSMTPTEQTNLRARMADWAKLPPEQREKARTQYQKLRTVPTEERRMLEEKWREYNALSPEQKQRLKQASKSASVQSGPSAKPALLQPPKPVALVPSTRKPKKMAPAIKKSALTQSKTSVISTSTQSAPIATSPDHL